jgi:hypothetical protein
MSRRNIGIHAVAPILLASLFALLTGLLVSDFFQDDAYISFRYAQNLSEELSLYYNPGERGPFGYSNPAYILMLALFRILSWKSLSFETISRIIAGISLGIIVFMVLKALLKDLWRRNRWTALFVICISMFFFGAFPFLLPNFWSGMETAPFTLALFGFLYSILWPSEKNENYSLALSPLLLFYIFGAIRARDWRKIRKLAYVLMFVASIFVLQFAISGHWVPLSLEQKRRDFSFHKFLVYIRFFAVVLSPLVIILTNRNSNKFIALLILHSFYVSFFYSFFFPWHCFRYIFPHAFSIFSILLVAIFKTWRDSDWKLISIFFIYSLFLFLPKTLQGYSWISGFRASMLNSKRIADALMNAKVDEENKLCALYDVGCIAYKTDWRIIDLSGLTTPEVRKQDVGTVVAELNPPVLIVPKFWYVPPDNVKLHSFYHEHSANIPRNYHFVKRLRLANPYWWPRTEYGCYIFVNERTDPGLVGELMSISVDADSEMGYQRRVFLFLQKLAGLGWFEKLGDSEIEWLHSTRRALKGRRLPVADRLDTPSLAAI